ncbi:MAG TPA: glycosyltransferase family 39 protein [Herpetosiphonaceae bacterium]|nr:glycosyltransferase family 39 protein [Herpetosiphonaceae bacterium]
MSVARNWVERGHYGRLLSGQLAPSGLEAAFPTTASVALSFRLFGVGIWQGRLVGVVFMVASVVVLHDLARRLYNRSVAVASLAVLLLLSMLPDLHPLTLSRQVFAEMPMMFYLLAGHTSFLLTLRRSLWFMLLAVGLWGLALITKGQVQPFLVVSLVVSLLTALLRRQWKMAALLGIALLGSFAVWKVLIWLQGLVLRDHRLPTTPIDGLLTWVALTPFSLRREGALLIALLFGLPTLLGLGYATWQWLKALRNKVPSDPRNIVRLALLALAGSWFAWYALLSAGFPRYLFPPVFVGSMFVAALLDDLTDHFSLSSLRRSRRFSSSPKGFALRVARPLLLFVLIAVPLPVTCGMLYHHYIANADTTPVEVARFLNTQTSPDALIETYDSELHFLLNRRYHYPPDQISGDIMHRRVIGGSEPIDYDPLAADPDYLVVGEQIRKWRLYEPVLATGAFRLLRRFGDYDVYERVR